MVKVELFECLDAVERDADGALDRERQPSLFNRLSWFRLLQQHCPPPGKLLVARAQDQAGARSWLFLAVHRRRAHAYANWYTLRFETIRDRAGEHGPDHDVAIATALRGTGLVTLRLGPLDKVLARSRRWQRGGWRTFGTETEVNWLVDVGSSSFTDYWARRPAKLRNTAERKAKTNALECLIYSHFDHDAWLAYESVYRSSWKPREGTPGFLQALAEQEGAAGTLRLGISWLDGQPVAAQLWLVERGCATIHKLAYRQDARRHSPGTVLSMKMFRSAIEVDRVSLIDFGLGDQAHKADWMDRREPIGNLVAYNRQTLPGALGAAREKVAALVRRARNT